MALEKLNLKVSKADFERKIQEASDRIVDLENIIERYGEAKKNLTQFVESNDSTYASWCERIELNITNCRKAKVALQESKATLEETVKQMDEMSGQMKEMVDSASEAARQVINTAIDVIL